MVKDPVCGMMIEPEKAAANYTYHGETYYFCAESCKAEFAKDPEKFIEKRERGGCCC